MQKNIEVIDLFCGVGGLTYGLKRSGLKVKAGIDNDETCKHAYESNNHSHFVNADIAKYDFRKANNFYSDDVVRVLVGCAPCQPFSSHSFKNKGVDNDRRYSLLKYFLEGVGELKPTIVFMENVRGLIKKNIFNGFIKKLRDWNYSVDYTVINFADYGVPQARKRLVLLASKLGQITVNIPQSHKTKNISVRAMIGNLPAINAGDMDAKDSLHRAQLLSPINKKRIKQSLPNGSWNNWDKSLLPECYTKKSGQTYTAVYGRMSWDFPAPTVTTQFYNYGSGRFGHPEQNRALSLREGALLQTFPKKYDFGKNITFAKIGRHIGNAVPPRIGHLIGRKIISHVKEFL